jgi:hypothetical protein
LLFESNRADIAKRRMEPDPVIKALHKFKDRLPGLCTRLEANEVNAFPLERSEERLGDGVIPTVAFAAHADRDAHFCKQRLIRMAGVLASSIGVMHSSGLGTALG